jgi:glycosyltransferase involved in cell wall biosynthesis
VKKGLLVYRVNRDDPANIGVIKKCKAQKKAFEQNGISVDMLWLCKDGVLENEALVLKADIPPHSLKVYRFYFLRFGKTLKTQVQKEGYDFIYLRHPFFDPLLVQALREIKQFFPKIKILLEINTYPYDAEPKRLLHKLSLKMDQHYRKTAHEYIDRIVDYGQRETIWGIPTISVRNGIDVESVQVSSSKPEKGRLRLIAVGNWSYWHGLDRLVLGFENYYKNEQACRVSLTIVGEGPETKNLKKFVSDKKMGQYIQFLPSTRGTMLDSLFENADVGIGTLGLHRKNVELDSSLKHREYCARGIPFILSSKDLDFSEELSFVNYVSKEEEPVDLDEVLNWFSKDMNVEAHSYAVKKLGWNKQLTEIFKWIEE